MDNGDKVSGLLKEAKHFISLAIEQQDPKEKYLLIVDAGSSLAMACDISAELYDDD